jgi:hypothetical protein
VWRLVVQAIQDAPGDVNRRFIGAQQHQALVHAFIPPQGRATARTRRCVRTNSARFAFGELTERGRLELTRGRMTCLERV